MTPRRGEKAGAPEHSPALGVSLAARLVLLVAGTVPLLLGAGFVVLQEARGLFRHQLVRTGEALANQFEKFAQDKLLTNDRPEIQRAVAGILKDDADIWAIELLGRDGLLVAGSLLGPENPARELRVKRQLAAQIDEKRTRDLGSLTIAYRTERIDRFVHRASAWVIWVTVGLTALIVLWLLGSLRRTVMLPIRELTAYARAFGAGEAPPPVEFARKAEFAVLARTLSGARGAVEERDRALITQFETVRAAYLQLDSILQSLGEGVLVVDEEGKIVLANGAITGVLGPPEGILGRGIQEFLPTGPERGRGAPSAFPAEGKPSLTFTTQVGRR
ncbi:MAG: PAS domain-containing protein, partial [Planctomycetota bacterium]